MQPWEASQHPRVTHISPAPRKLSSTAALCPCTELISKLLIIKVRPGTSWLPLGTLPYNQDILIPRFLYPHLSHSLFLTQGGLPNTKGTWVHSQATVMSGSPPCGGNDHPTPPLPLWAALTVGWFPSVSSWGEKESALGAGGADRRNGNCMGSGG